MQSLGLGFRAFSGSDLVPLAEMSTSLSRKHHAEVHDLLLAVAGCASEGTFRPGGSNPGQEYRGLNFLIITYTILGAPQYNHRNGHQNPNLIIKAPTLPCWPSHASAEGSRRPELPGTSSLRPLMSLHAYILLRLLRSVSI